LEKFGTGAPNTTGAYELDLAELNNFTAAWRSMHVTDIFCSASLTLPDKAGRQINIGGWANDATYGIRLYWPDGSPGIAGNNDWQENVKDVSLQNGRCYPTAMIMVSFYMSLNLLKDQYSHSLGKWINSRRWRKRRFKWSTSSYTRVTSKSRRGSLL